MRPRERRESGEQDLFRSRLDQIIAMSHPQVRLAKAINWRFLEERFGAVYTDGAGRPPLPTRPRGPQRPWRVRRQLWVNCRHSRRHLDTSARLQ